MRTVKDMGFIGWKVGAAECVGGGGTVRLMGCRTGGAGTEGIDGAPNAESMLAAAAKLRGIQWCCEAITQPHLDCFGAPELALCG